ncbi:hypothetical protein [Acetobacter aceti]|uniref:Uncharacterized protein n=1 Tax=Acetobacter aceti TaxID=435 RepID=A0A6S6PSI0_ACEAC|nr:hypothetical protein [Acetobacter aceti]BCI68074.1 hypothetical protein AAJCM20276_26980 [Acetobacter aceti]
MATSSNTTTRFDNVSDAMLADMIGYADAKAKAAAEEVSALKEELKRRGAEKIEGSHFSVTNKEQISARLDTKAIRARLGDEVAKFEVPSISQVIRVKANAAALATLAS